MHKIFLDTNVIVDFLLGREPGCTACKQIIASSDNGKHVLYGASTSLKDAYYLVGANLKRIERVASGNVTEDQANAIAEIAWACARQMMRTLVVVPVGRSECLDAFTIRGIHNDFEDNLVFAAARAANADFLVTSDERLRKHAPLGCLSPSEMATLLTAEEEAISRT